MSIRIRRRLPPYARKIIAARSSSNLRRWWGTSPDGQHPTLIVCAGKGAWHTAVDWEGHRLVTLLPPGDDPDRYDWTCLAGTDPVLLWRCGATDEDDLARLLPAIMRDGTNQILDVLLGTQYIAEVQYAAA